MFNIRNLLKPVCWVLGIGTIIACPPLFFIFLGVGITFAAMLLALVSLLFYAMAVGTVGNCVNK